ncbi:Rv1733c family protein [Streptomyces sp. NPDC002004]
MTGMTWPVRTPGRRWRRRHSPLRRRCDRIQAWTALCAGVVLLLGVPLAAFAAGRAAADDARSTANAQRASRHLTAARLTRNAPARSSSDYGTGRRYPVKVRWTAPEGAVRTGAALVPAGARRGETTHIWLDARGRVAAAPLTSDRIVARVTSAVVGTAAAIALPTGLLHLLVRRATERHRMARWEREWERIGPEWSSRTA